MPIELLEKIDLGKIAKELERHANQWVAISSDNEIIGSGDTYEAALRGAEKRSDVVLFKVPPLDASLAL